MTSYDCFTYSGDIAMLTLRLDTLDPVIDYFVIVEMVPRHAGGTSQSQLRAQWPEVRRWARKIRHVVVVVESAVKPVDQHALEWNSVGRGLADLAPGDAVFLSDATSIPSPLAVAQMAGQADIEQATFQVRESVLMLNYANLVTEVGGIAVRGALLASSKPAELIRACEGSHQGSDAALEGIGWRLTHIGDIAGINARLPATRGRSTRKASLPDHVSEMLQRKDLLRRNDQAWTVAEIAELPVPVHENADQHESVILADSSDAATQLAAMAEKPPTALAVREPVIICPYLHDEDQETVRQAFGLDDDRGRRLPFFFWQDTERIGPERAFEHCWNQFPDRDVIIIHPDMYPMPDDPNNTWFERLLDSVEDLPDAGAIGCDLIFPEPTETGELAAQCVGGKIREGKIKHMGGRNRVYDERYRGVRQTEWATFGGVYIRREAIDMCGSFDDDYKWAYVMDVDYCMRIQLHGLRTYQVPVNLIHEENGTTKDFLVDPLFRAKMDANFEVFDKKWRGFFRGRPQLQEARARHRTLPKFPGG